MIQQSDLTSNSGGESNTTDTDAKKPLQDGRGARGFTVDLDSTSDECLLKELAAGRRLNIEYFSVSADVLSQVPAAGTIWVTSPYGNDIACPPLSVEGCARVRSIICGSRLLTTEF